MAGTSPGRRVTETQDFTVETAETFHYLFQVFPLQPGEAPEVHRLGPSGTIGRSPDDGNAIVVPDPLMSRVHAEYRRTSPGPYHFADRASKNGMFVDGVQVDGRQAAEGTVIRLGGTVFVLREVGLDLPEPPPRDAGFVGFSPPFRRAVEACRRAAPGATTVLLCGDTGTGKEVLARYVHALSGRSGRFVPVNCAAVSPGLFESALFGHRKGAFTGAAADFAGFARSAHGGTLFLDEVGELAGEVQAKLLRFLEAGEVATVGDSSPTRVDVRVLAATNRDLEAAVAAGSFRRDLYARIAQRVVRLAPLRERPEDVLVLVTARLRAAGLTLAPDAAEALALHDWPYNVRELIALVEDRRLETPDGGVVTLAALPEAIRARAPGGREGAAVPRAGAPTRDELAAVLDSCGGNVSETARRLGKDRRQVYRWLTRHGLLRDEGCETTKSPGPGKP